MKTMTKEQIEKMQAARRARASQPREPKPSRKTAIREKCKDCIYDEHSPGTWLQQVTACEDKACALWPVRPVRKMAEKSSCQFQGE